MVNIIKKAHTSVSIMYHYPDSHLSKFSVNQSTEITVLLKYCSVRVVKFFLLFVIHVSNLFAVRVMNNTLLWITEVLCN